MFSNKTQSKVEIQENFVTNLRLNGQFYSTGTNDSSITKSRRRDGFLGGLAFLGALLSMTKR